MLAPALDSVRLTLHVLAATVWVGGQIVMTGPGRAGPPARGGDATKTLARAFARMAWPAYLLLIVTGIWNVTAVHYSSQVGLEGGAHGQDRRGDPGRGGRRPAPAGEDRAQLALWGSVSGVASVAALVMGVLLAG